MKKKDILQSIRDACDLTLNEAGFRFKAKFDSYIRYDQTTGIYHEIAFTVIDYASSANINAKYVDVYVNIYHDKISEILLTASNRRLLGSIFYFKIFGNLLADILLNPLFQNYNKRNNHNYFQLIYANENDLFNVPIKMHNIIVHDAMPFLLNFKGLHSIKTVLDYNCSGSLSLCNSNIDRLMSLVAILGYLKDKDYKLRTQEISNYLTELSLFESLAELNQLIEVVEHL